MSMSSTVNQDSDGQVTKDGKKRNPSPARNSAPKYNQRQRNFILHVFSVLFPDFPSEEKAGVLVANDAWAHHTRKLIETILEVKATSLIKSGEKRYKAWSEFNSFQTRMKQLHRQPRQKRPGYGIDAEKVAQVKDEVSKLEAASGTDQPLLKAVNG